MEIYILNLKPSVFGEVHTVIYEATAGVIHKQYKVVLGGTVMT